MEAEQTGLTISVVPSRIQQCRHCGSSGLVPRAVCHQGKATGGNWRFGYLELQQPFVPPLNHIVNPSLSILSFMCELSAEVPCL